MSLLTFSWGFSDKEPFVTGGESLNKSSMPEMDCGGLILSDITTPVVFSTKESGATGGESLNKSSHPEVDFGLKLSDSVIVVFSAGVASPAAENLVKYESQRIKISLSISPNNILIFIINNHPQHHQKREGKKAHHTNMHTKEYKMKHSRNKSK